MPKYTDAPIRRKLRRRLIVIAAALAVVAAAGFAWSSTNSQVEASSNSSGASDGGDGVNVASKVARLSPERPTPSATPTSCSTPTATPTPTATEESPQEPTHTAEPPTATPDSPEPTSEPESGEFPNAETTGVPEGTDLKSSESITVTEDGAVIDAREINGTVKVEANDVTIKNSRIVSSGRYAVEVASDAKNLVIEDTEIDGNGKATIAILRGEFTLRRANIHDVQDGPRIEGDNVLIEDSYIHDLHRVEGGHHDALQMRQGSNVIIRNNNLQAYDADADDPMNAAIQFGSALGPINNVVFDGNLMNGGNYTVNGGGDDINDSSIVFRNNQFGRDFRYGVVTGTGGMTWESSNVFYDTGDPVK